VGGARAEGVDVSVYQGTIDWAKVKAAGISFGICRVSDGTNTLDSTFTANWKGMKAQGLVRGVYQFFRPSQDPVAQADLLASKVGAIGPGDLPPTCDVEVTDGVAAATIVARVQAWSAEIEKKLDVTPMIYISPGFSSALGSPTVFWANDLWVAHWGVATPSVPASWKDWTFWQWTDKGSVNGISGVVDRDRFHGSVEDLQAFAGLDVGPDFHRGLAEDSTGKGYWMVGLTGTVTAYGDATWRGTAGGATHPQPFLGVVRSPSGLGYWLFAADGAVSEFGDAVNAGDLSGKTLGAPIVGLAPTATGKGYWLVGRDGSVHAFGDAQSYGQPAHLTDPIVGVAATPTGKGYFLAGADGAIYAYGDAIAQGSAAGQTLAHPVTGIARTITGKGYWLAQSNGDVLSFGDATKMLYTGARTPKAPIVSITPTLTGKGYWLVAGDGTILAVGDALDAGPRAR